MLIRPRSLLIFTLVFLILILSTLSYASDFGYSRVRISRSWTIGNVDGTSVDFTGAIAVNNSNQNVIEIILDPGMTSFKDENGTIHVHYHTDSSAKTLTLNASALIAVDYNTSIHEDPPLPQIQAVHTFLTEPDALITGQAGNLSTPNSSLETIRDVVQWVHEYVTYDPSYWGKTLPAKSVFDVKRGVCVEYTHLLISMLQSLGFKTRYVGGFVYADAWQPHAWAEVYLPSYGWLPVDPTYGQIGILDNSHVAFSYGDDQNSIYDMILTYSTEATLEVKDNVTMLLSYPDPRGLDTDMSFDNETYSVDVKLASNRSDFVFASHNFISPNIAASKIILLKPYEEVHRYYAFNRSQFQPGFTYTIPVTSRLGDVTSEKIFDLDTRGQANSTATTSPTTSSCPTAQLLILVLGTTAIISWLIPPVIKKPEAL